MRGRRRAAPRIRAHDPHHDPRIRGYPRIRGSHTYSFCRAGTDHAGAVFGGEAWEGTFGFSPGRSLYTLAPKTNVVPARSAPSLQPK